MTSDKTTRQNRVREALGRIYDQHPPLFREYLRRFQEDPTSRVFAPLAEAYRRLGRVDEAIEICREGLQHHPDFHGGRVALAKCLLEKKAFPEAKSELERVVQQVPENLLAQRLLGDTLMALKDPASALHCYKMALLLSPTDVQLAEKVHSMEKALASGAFGSASATAPGNQPAPTVAESPRPAGMALDDLPPLWEEVEVPTESTPAASAMPAPAPVPVVEDLEPLEPLEPLGDLAPRLDEVVEAPIPAALEQEDEPTLESHPEINALLGVEASSPDEESFRIEHVSNIFGDTAAPQKKEITTETLADLYFSQGQYDRALRIFEKILSDKPSPELDRKIALCRMKLGVDRGALVRQKQIDLLRGLLRHVQAVQARPASRR